MHRKISFGVFISPVSSRLRPCHVHVSHHVFSFLLLLITITDDIRPRLLGPCVEGITEIGNGTIIFKITARL